MGRRLSCTWAAVNIANPQYSLPRSASKSIYIVHVIDHNRELSYETPRDQDDGNCVKTALVPSE